MRNSQMHEVGLRLLVRKIQLIGAQYEKALIPIYSLSADHYMKIFFLCKKGKKDVDKVLRKHEFFHHCDDCLSNFSSPFNKGDCLVCGSKTVVAGPLYSDKLFDARLAEKVFELAKGLYYISDKTKKITSIISEEAKFNGLGFFRLNDITKRFKIVHIKKDLLKKEGFYPTHLEPNAVKCEGIGLLVPKFSKKNKKGINATS